VLLPDAVDAADALLDLHRIPRQIVIDQEIGSLEIEPLGRGVGADQDVDLTTDEPVLDLVPFDADPVARRRIDITPALA
jgi:hypothetical protein